MAIKASAAHHIKALIDDLTVHDETTREVATARLIVFGAPAVDHLAALAGDAASPSAARVAALGALEAIGDPRSLPTAAKVAAETDDYVATATVSLVRAFLSGPRGVEALDVLTALVLDSTCSDALRLAALDALRGFDAKTLQPILHALANDPRPMLREASQRAASQVPGNGATEQSTLESDESILTDDPAAVRRRVLDLGARLSLPALQRIVVRIRERETEASADRRLEWAMARASAHVALAKRGSLLGLYDLRESLEAAHSPVPVELLAALVLIGDKSCLEPIVGAYARTAAVAGGTDDWWPRHLADAFHAIVKREGLIRRHAPLKRAETRWPEAFYALWHERGPRRTKAKGSQ